MKSRLTLFGVLAGLIASIGCSQGFSDALNPYDDPPENIYGERSNRAILEDGGESQLSDRARHALETMGSYRRAQEPQPTYPVVQPAEVRLMWVPDHLNKAGDLVPAHYYYLRVLNDRWAVQDAFDLEEQLNKGSKGAGSATPWVYK